jgi:hypothetical protein
MNLNVDVACIKKALCEAWRAFEATPSVPDIKPLLTEKYSREEWNLKF